MHAVKMPLDQVHDQVHEVRADVVAKEVVCGKICLDDLSLCIQLLHRKACSLDDLEVVTVLCFLVAFICRTNLCAL